ncbi:hypothetical protein BDV28DRAFT_137084 [Aspergillus coremiiformis]|uniref:RlpA-like double-psi beta-barrel-protein domain-containing protein-containing protein n=1 Tax=Aspergillus coremiiformis TaxID=138285 RepID=A0A5N6Z1A4_9EURO|nr:hypothetical protein BDV28DRAFT_137084 [Aspergillus coremiiformis]
MAPLAKTLALAGALFSAVGSTAPAQKRQDGADTKTVVQWTTVTVTTTITTDRWPTPSVAQPTVSAAPAVTTPEAPKSAEKPNGPEESEENEGTEAQQQYFTLQPMWSSSAVQPAPQPTNSAPTEPQPTNSAPTEPQPTVPPQQPSTTNTPPAVVPTQPSTTTGAAPQPSASSPGGTYSGTCSQSSPCKGQVTFYDTAVSMSNPSSCGVTNDGATEDVLALPVGMMMDSHCGRKVTVNYNGKVWSGTVVDKCMGCDSTSIDLSRHFFQELASESVGRLHGVEWYIS